MLQTTKGIVLRSVKYGDTSLISTIFTEVYGVQSYIVQGVRTAKARNNRAGLLQPATLLDIVAEHKPNRNLQRLREFHPSYIYTSLQEEIVKNSIALFSVEILLRLLPEHAITPELFHFSYTYFCELDKKPAASVANFPIYFMIQCGRLLGYDIHGAYSSETPHLNLSDGVFSNKAPDLKHHLNDEDAKLLESFLRINSIEDLEQIEINAATRNRLLDWYLDFLHEHTQHLGNIKSLAVLRAVLH